MTMASKQVQEQETYALPPGYETRSAGFARAYEHARRNGNGDKASLLFAEAWAHSFEETRDA
jgi:hypothetical protein